MLLKPPGPSQTSRAIVILIGFIGGSSLGFYCLSDYDLIKRLPPKKMEFNEDGTPKGLPFSIRFEPARELQLKPEVLEKRKEAERKYLEEGIREKPWYQFW